jgi:hypothetical protein
MKEVHFHRLATVVKKHLTVTPLRGNLNELVPIPPQNKRK